MNGKTFLICFDTSPDQFGPIMRVAELIIRDHGLDGHVIVPKDFSFSTSYHSLTKLSINDFYAVAELLTLHFLPGRNGCAGRFGFESKSLETLLKKLKPEFIWIHAEFWEGIARQFLWHYRFQKNPSIVAYVALNDAKSRIPLLSAQFPFLSRTRLYQILLWPRLDGVAACATKSMECARRIGLPEQVPVAVNYLPVFGPKEAAREGITLPWQRNTSFVIGFAGFISEQKGWKILLRAVGQLPERFKLVLAGDGEQRDELETWLKKPALKNRAYFAGWLPKDRLLGTYPLFDVFVLPSLTKPPSPEQFGCVLAEAMACGVPVIGSNSGAIPETVGEAGLIVPEGDPDALAKAIFKMSEDDHLRKRAIAWGLERYRTHYSCEAYARSIVGLLHIP